MREKNPIELLLVESNFDRLVELVSVENRDTHFVAAERISKLKKKEELRSRRDKGGGGTCRSSIAKESPETSIFLISPTPPSPTKLPDGWRPVSKSTLRKCLVCAGGGARVPFHRNNAIIDIEELD